LATSCATMSMRDARRLQVFGLLRPRSSPSSCLMPLSWNLSPSSFFGESGSPLGPGVPERTLIGLPKAVGHQRRSVDRELAAAERVQALGEHHAAIA